jgi:hypothetical protein
MNQVLLLLIIGLVKCQKKNETKSLLDEWDKNMQSFIPDDMISFSIEGMSEEVI